MAYQNPESVAAGAPPWHLPQPQPKSRPSGIQGFVWAVWPWMNWVLPTFFVLHGFLGVGGWATLLLLFASPVFIPATGLLGSLPRFLLRKRGHTTTPAPIVGLLFVNWWGWVALTLTMQDAGDSGPLASLLRSMLTVPLSVDYEQGLYVVAIGVAITAWLAVLVIAIVLPRATAATVVPGPPAAPTMAAAPAAVAPPHPPTTTGRPRDERPWVVVAWVSAFLVPALFVTAVVVGVEVTAAQPDASGDTVAEVAAMPIAAQVDRAEQNYERTQQRLSEVRELIAEDGWRLRDEDGEWVGSAGFGTSAWECRQADVDCYTFQVRFSLDQAPADFDRARFDDSLRDAGWTPPEYGDGWTDAEGYRLRVTVYPANNRLSIELESPEWWGDTYDLRNEMGDSDDDNLGLGRTYRFDEWPPLD